MLGVEGFKLFFISGYLFFLTEFSIHFEILLTNPLKSMIRMSNSLGRLHIKELVKNLRDFVELVVAFDSVNLEKNIEKKNNIPYDEYFL